VKWPWQRAHLPKQVAAPPSVQFSFAIKFDPENFTVAAKRDVEGTLRSLPDIHAADFDVARDAAFAAMSVGGDLGALTRDLLGLPNSEISKDRCGAIAMFISNRANCTMKIEHEIALGISKATWRYSGAPCLWDRDPTEQQLMIDMAHRAASGTTFDLKEGLLILGKPSWPGREWGCKCAHRPIIPGLA